jgi:hypothetical protein
MDWANENLKEAVSSQPSASASDFTADITICISISERVLFDKVFVLADG